MISPEQNKVSACWPRMWSYR